MAKNPETSNINFFTDEQLKEHDLEVVDALYQTHHVFTEEQLIEHDLNLAYIVQDATATHVARQMVGMNAGQQLKSMTHDCKSLKFSDETLKTIVQVALDKEQEIRNR